MPKTICNGDATILTIPQAFADLSGSAANTQMPGGMPTGTGPVVMQTGGTLVAPVLGTPASGNLVNCTFPVLNQNTSGTAANATKISTDGTANQVWSMDSGGTVQSWRTVSGGSGSPGGSNTQIQYNSSGSFGGASGITTDGTNLSTTGYIDYAGLNTPAAPAANTVRVFGRSVANRMMLAQEGPSGLDTALQPLLARNKVGYWNPAGNATTVPGVFGITAPTASGTATARNVATNNLANRMRRIGYPSSTTAGTFAGARIAVAQFTAGSGSSDGSGFMMIERWTESDPAAVAGRREFIGMSSNTSAPTNVEPNTLTNTIGIGQLSTDATQYYWIQGGSSAQTAVAIGTGIGAPAGNSTTAWELAIFAPASIANTFYLQLTNLSTGVTATTTMSGSATVVPQSSTLLAWRHWATNNATALAVGMDLCSLYFETDF